MAIALQPKFPVPDRSKQPVRSTRDEEGVIRCWVVRWRSQMAAPSALKCGGPKHTGERCIWIRARTATEAINDGSNFDSDFSARG
jgi:hypothetical protein